MFGLLRLNQSLVAFTISNSLFIFVLLLTTVTELCLCLFFIFYFLLRFFVTILERDRKERKEKEKEKYQTNTVREVTAVYRCSFLVASAGLVPKQTDQVEEKARGGDGHGQEEAGLGDGEAEGQLGERGGGRRLQQAAGPKLGRRENNTAAQETQAGRRAADAHVRERQLLNPPLSPTASPSRAGPRHPAPHRL